MFGLESLDVMIGVITIYLMFALACTATVEAISAWFDVRSKNLEDAMSEFLHGETATGGSFVQAFYNHPLVQSLSVGTDGRPSYIEPSQVSRVVTDIVLAQQGASAIKEAIEKLPGTAQDNRIKGLLDSLQSEAKDDIAEFRKLVEQHYDATMDRASGWYKRKTHNIAFYVSLTFVLLANVDTLSLVNTLSTNPQARAAMVELAQQQLDTANVAQAASAPATASEVSAATPVTNALNRSKNAGEVYAKTNVEISQAGIQLGWKNCPKGGAEWVSKIIGLLISTLAISLGAPFWFDILSRVMKVRAAGVSPRDKKPAGAGNV